jgi:hypothetical protein
MLSIPHCIDSRLIDGGKIVTPKYVRMYVWAPPWEPSTCYPGNAQQSAPRRRSPNVSRWSTVTETVHGVTRKHQQYRLGSISTRQTRNESLLKKQTLVRSPKVGSTPRRTDWLTVSRKVTVTVWWVSQPSARGYNWATLFPGDINTGTWPSRLGESQMRQ